MQLAVDLVLAALGVLTVIRYARRGVITGLAALIGWLLGFWVALLLTPALIRSVNALAAALPLWERNVIVLVVVLLIAVVCAVIVIAVGNLIRRAVRPLPAARGVDAVFGAVFGALAWAVAVWLAAGFATSTGFAPAAQLADSSRIVTALDSVAPLPAQSVFAGVDDAIAAAGLPKVFQTGKESIPGVAAPPSSVPAAVGAAAPSIVEVQADEPKCGTDSSGSGWVVASERVVTNAHVVAGSASTAVLVDGKTERLHATVVGYDPETDLAILDVPGLDAKPLAQDAAQQSKGAAVFAAGYPGGGDYTVAPGRVRTTVNAIGKDIYNDKDVTRQVYSLRTVVRPGDSGGPLLDPKGKVTGVVFAMSTTDSETGYALTLAQVKPMLTKAASLTKPVATGACTAG